MYNGSPAYCKEAHEAPTACGLERGGRRNQLYDLPGIDVIGILSIDRVLPVRLSALILLILISDLIINL